ncbi:hypothetical protein D3P08_00135 [Paenibacillus nanensis]|uniref:Uncharacterized protein n=1 Tax=Paenibacillus nanensis TaxID=393251 RepID=A0A3A1VGM0_9BACL|nr:hypothetical protein D3P08_00135 [Paenibacillus nanensis]
MKQFRIEPRGFKCRQVKTVEEATHWLPILGNRFEEYETTPFQLYRIFHDRYDDEFLIMDDNNNFSLIHIWHKGRYVVLEETWK